MKQKQAQNLIEYILIFAMVAIVCSMFVIKLDLRQIKNHVFDRPADTTNPSRINIEPMTE